MYRQRNKQKYFTQHFCGKVKAKAASPGHKKTPTDFTDSLSLTQVLHKRKFFLSYLVAKKMQTSAKKACFQFAECSFSYAKIRLYPETHKDLGWKRFFEKKIGGSRYVREPPSNLFLFLHFLDFLQWKFGGC